MENNEKVFTVKDIKEQLAKVQAAKTQCETSFYQLSGQEKLLLQQIAILEELGAKPEVK